MTALAHVMLKRFRCGSAMAALGMPCWRFEAFLQTGVAFEAFREIRNHFALADLSTTWRRRQRVGRDPRAGAALGYVPGGKEDWTVRSKS
jgi:hypothetical protein